MSNENNRSDLEKLMRGTALSASLAVTGTSGLSACSDAPSSSAAAVFQECVPAGGVATEAQLKQALKDNLTSIPECPPQYDTGLIGAGYWADRYGMGVSSAYSGYSPSRAYPSRYATSQPFTISDKRTRAKWHVTMPSAQENGTIHGYRGAQVSSPNDDTYHSRRASSSRSSGGHHR